MQLGRKVEYQLVDKVKSIFPEENSVPAEFQLKAPSNGVLDQRRVRHWAGPTQESFSSIYLRTSALALPKLIGSFRNCWKRSPEALDAASFTTMVGDPGPPCSGANWSRPRLRIRMKENGRSQTVDVRLANFTDSEKEFDRTIAYIEDTIDALKNLDRTTRFVLEQGIQQIRRPP